MNDHLHFTTDPLGRIDVGAVGAISIEPADDGTHHIVILAVIDGEVHSVTLEALGLTQLEACIEPADDADQVLYTADVSTPPLLTALPGGRCD